MKAKKRFLDYCLPVLPLIIAIVIFGIYIRDRLSLYDDSRKDIKTADDFLQALLEGDERKAKSYLSEELKTAVKEYCPDERVTRCIDGDVSSEWGKFKGTAFTFGSKNHIGFATWWSSIKDGVWVVVDVEEQNGRWYVVGWRGFVLTADENQRAEIISGQQRPNAFPPIE